MPRRPKSFVTMPSSGQKDGASRARGSSRAPAPPAARRARLQEELRENTRNIADGAKAIQPKNTKRKYAGAQKEWRDWCAVKGWDDGDMVSEQKLCLFLNKEVIGRESRARGYAARRKRKLADRRARLGPAEKRRKGKGRAEEVVDTGADLDTDTDTDTNTESDREEEERDRDRDRDEPMDTALDTASEDEGDEGDEGGHDNSGPAAGADNDDPDDPDADEATLFRETVGFSVVESYVNGLTELWKEQRRDSANPHSVLRGKELSDLLEVVKCSDWDRRRAEYVDRALFTVVDGYDPPKMMAGIAWCWQEGSQARNGPEPYLRTAADFLIGHFMVLRGESRRMAQLPDLVSLPLPNEGPTPCEALILIMRNGKTNKYHRVEYMGALRNKDVLLCPLSALAFYFFWRWGYVATDSRPRKQSAVEAWRRLPSFYKPSDYYDIRAFPGEIKYPERQWGYEGQREWVERLFAGAGIESSKKTHATRKQAAQHAEVAGVKEAQIRRAGRWRNDAMSGVYLSSLPRKFMRKLAGFREEGGNFFLPRASVEPPPELTRLIWPEADDWLAKMEAYRPKSRRNQVQRRDLAGSGFLRLLRVLRTVLLQDSVVLRRLFPDHRIWKADVFASEAYKTFAADAAAASEAGEEPEDLRLKKALPVLYDKITMMHQDLKQSLKLAIRENAQETRAAVEAAHDAAFAAGMREFQAAVQDFTSGRRSVIVRASNPDADPGNAPGPPQSTAAAPVASDPAPDSSPARFDPSMEPIRYRFDRKVTTVTELWTEWSVGLGSGPSIQRLDSTWGARWKDQNERQFYSRRLPIIKALKDLYESGAAPSLLQAASQLEKKRGSMTLNKFGKVLKKQAAGGATASDSE